MRLTIERLRTLVLASGLLLVLALIVFLVLAHWKTREAIKELPKKLGADIQRQADEFVYTQSHGGRTLFKIRASRLIQLKNGGHAELHDVHIDLYGPDGKSVVDRISGGQFQYDQKAGIASADGPVEISILNPNQSPAVVPGRGDDKHPQSPLAHAERAGQIDVKTSGLTFEQKTGIASTNRRVEFAIAQGSGSSLGATFDSRQGTVVLDKDVQLNVHRGPDIVVLRAAHGEFVRDALTCNLRDASAAYRNGQAQAGQAQVQFRQNGSAVRLNARDGFRLTSASGANIAAPTGSLDFDQKSQPTHGHLDGGVTMSSASANRTVQGSAPSAQLVFASGGVLRHAHLERGVTLHTEQDAAKGARLRRDWRSPVADIDFRKGRRGELQIASVQGTGGVEVTSQTVNSTGQAAPSSMAADAVTATFGPHQELTRITGSGNARLEQTTATGVRQSTSGDHLVVQLQPDRPAAAKTSSASSLQIQSATIDGHVKLTQQQPAKPGKPAPPPMIATAGRATYDGGSQRLRLTLNPWIDDAGLQLSADRVDVSQDNGDTSARGNVKATWVQDNGNRSGNSTRNGSLTLGGEGPGHVIAEQAELHRASDKAVFRGHARLWQGPNSISAPEILLDRAAQLLLAHGSGTSQPVNLVLLGNETAGSRSAPSLVQVRAADLKYSAAQRTADLESGDGKPVRAETGGATATARQVRIDLLPPGSQHAGNEPAAPAAPAAQVQKLTASGDVIVTSQGRRGTGDQMVYTAETGDYVLTGTPSTPPRMTDPAHGTITGQALIFNSRDDSVSIEGQGQKTLTQTVAPR